MKYAEKKKKKQAKVGNSNNVADHIMETASMINEHDFVQVMIHSKGKPPSVILYTPHQLEHMLSCVSQTSVIGVDRTFNLGCSL